MLPGYCQRTCLTKHFFAACIVRAIAEIESAPASIARYIHATSTKEIIHTVIQSLKYTRIFLPVKSLTFQVYSKYYTRCVYIIGLNLFINLQSDHGFNFAVSTRFGLQIIGLCLSELDYSRRSDVINLAVICNFTGVVLCC